MTGRELTADQIIHKTIRINAPASNVWDTLTNPVLINRWMLDGETGIDIISEWKPGSSIIFRGDLHGLDFENKGTILQYEPGKVFEYNFWSSLSQNADIPENYSVIRFELTPAGDTTTLAFTQTGFVTETIYQHFNFYWNTALDLIRKLNENL